MSYNFLWNNLQYTTLTFSAGFFLMPETFLIVIPNIQEVNKKITDFINSKHTQ